MTKTVPVPETLDVLKTTALTHCSLVDATLAAPPCLPRLARAASVPSDFRPGYATYSPIRALLNFLIEHLGPLARLVRRYDTALITTRLTK